MSDAGADSRPTVGAQFGAAVRAAREKAGISQSEAALRADMDASAWAKLERGMTANPTLVAVLTIVAALNVPAGELLQGITAARRRTKLTAARLIRERRSS
ncbi:MAG: XRE family transcriptional regulator [Microbacteriaceae bacterium]|nr:MAG: XRE family transcriptional regulator [Microbacteriaceae bacterium]